MMAKDLHAQQSSTSQEMDAQSGGIPDGQPSENDNVNSLAVDGKAVLAWRKKAGLTQEDFAARVGLSGGFISLIERNRARVSMAAASRIAALISLDLAELIRAEDRNSPSMDLHSRMVSLMEHEHSSIHDGTGSQPERQLHDNETGFLPNWIIDYQFDANVSRIDIPDPDKAIEPFDLLRSDFPDALSHPRNSTSIPLVPSVLQGAEAREPSFALMVLQSPAEVALQEARAAIKNLEYAKGESILSELLTASPNQKGGPEYVNRYGVNRSVQLLAALTKVDLDHSRGKISDAISTSERWIELTSSTASVAKERARLFIRLAELHDIGAYSFEARRCLDKAALLIQGPDWDHPERKQFYIAFIARVRGTIAITNGRFSEAEYNLSKSCSLARVHPDIKDDDSKRLQAYAERELSRLRVRQGYLDFALDHATRSYQLRKEFEPTERAWGRYFSQLADVYRYAVKSPQLPRLYAASFEALSIFERLGSQLDVARVALRLSRLCRKTQPHLGWDAAYWATRALQFAEFERMPFIHALAERQFGLALASTASTHDYESAQLKLNEATQYLQSSLKKLERQEDPFERALGQRVLAQVLISRSVEETSSRHLVRRAYDLLTESYESLRAMDAKIERDRAKELRDCLTLGEPPEALKHPSQMNRAWPTVDVATRQELSPAEP